MSRIEKVLEKAAEIRESAQGGAAEKPVTTDPRIPFAGFEIGGPAANPDKSYSHLICLTDPNSLFAEQYKKLRARILKATAKNFLNTIMVTSPGAGEGKTITAINLAISIASEIDYTVLLVDTDLKRPSIHKYLGIETEYGLSDCLTGKAELSDVMIKTGIGKLIFLPAGNATENAAELLSSERMKMLVNEMKQRYKDRYIIFDSSPLLLTSDAIPLSNYIDGVLLVIQASRTTPKDASLAVSQIKGSNILGVVFNNVPKYLAANLYPYYHLYEKEGYYQKPQENKEIENNR
jgi:protein-tyrosine kinase